MPQVIRVKGKDFPARLRRDMRKLGQRVLKAVHKTAAEGADVAIQTVPVAFGELAGTIRDIPHAAGATIRADAPHAAAVELGSRPHKPPIWPLKKWCELKGIPVQIAWAIQAKIAKQGTRPTWFMGRTVPAVERLVDVNIKSALAEDL